VSTKFHHFRTSNSCSLSPSPGPSPQRRGIKAKNVFAMMKSLICSRPREAPGFPREPGFQPAESPQGHSLLSSRMKKRLSP